MTISTLQTAIQSRDWDGIEAVLDQRQERMLVQHGDAFVDTVRSIDQSWYVSHPRNWVELQLALRVKVLTGTIWSAYLARIGRAGARTARDDIIVGRVRMRQLVFTGAFDEAIRIAHIIERRIATSGGSGTLIDRAPVAFGECATAYFLGGDVDDARRVLHDARRWAAVGAHPAGELAELLDALICGLIDHIPIPVERFREMLSRTGQLGNVPGRGALLSMVELLSASLTGGGVDDAMAVAQLGHGRDAEIGAGDLWWVIDCACARFILVIGDVDARAAAIVKVRQSILLNNSIARPRSTAGWLLRSVLADLHQSVSGTKYAREVLNEIPADVVVGDVVASRARLLVFEGEQDLARRLLRDVDEFHPANNVVLDVLRYALAADTNDDISLPMYRDMATMSIARTGAWSALIEVPKPSRAPLSERFPQAPLIADPFTRRRRGVLTRREQQVFEELRAEDTIRSLAARLYISPHTAKSHVHCLYQKIGARNRRHALQLRDEMGLTGTPARTEPGD